MMWIPQDSQMKCFCWALCVLLVVGWSSGSCARSPRQTEKPLPTTPSDSATAPFAEPRRLLQQGKNAEAVARLQDLAARNPAMPGLQHELGIAYYKSGEYVKAIDALGKAVHDDPEDNEAVQLLGLSSYLGGRPAEAIPLLEKVQGWYPRATSMPPTFWEFATSRPRTIRAPASRSRACSRCRRTRRPPIC